MKYEIPKLSESTINQLVNSDSREICNLGLWHQDHDPRSVALIIKALHEGQGLPLNTVKGGAPFQALELMGIADFKASIAYKFFRETFPDYSKKLLLHSGEVLTLLSEVKKND